MADQSRSSSSFSPDILELQEKGSLFILMALGLAEDGLTFTEIRDMTNLSNGTTQRRLESLEEANWIEKEAKLNESGNAVARYSLSDDTREMLDALRELGSTILG